jgi:hypothetical protein
MCVIMVVKDDKVRPTVKMLEKAAEYNEHGIGAAWREGKGEEKVVCWKKGIENEELDSVIKLAAELPVPYVLHFRAMSIGDICKQLTHPFPIDNRVPLALTGKTKGRVWFHNGTWDDWRKWMLEAVIKSGVKLPPGKWSDSRAIAFLSSLHGDWFAELLADSQKGVVFGPNDYELYMGKSGWIKVEEVWCSNNDFILKKRGPNGTTYYITQTTHSYATGGHSQICRFGQCKRYDTVDGYCPIHPGGVLKRDAIIQLTDAEVAAGAGGSRSDSSTPFFRIPKGQIIGLELAERLFHVKELKSGKRVISRGMIKEIKKQYTRLESKDHKESLKGRKALERVTEKLNNSESFLQNLKIFQPLSGLAS